MPTEIERKFIVDDDGWRDDVTRAVHMRQGYFRTSSDSTVRARLVEPADGPGEATGVLTIKGRPRDADRRVRPEFEYEIPADDAESMLELFCGDRTVQKTRHHVPAGDHVWVVDVFERAHAGLVLAEVELEAADEHVDLPEWIDREVTGDGSFTNAALARQSD